MNSYVEKLKTMIKSTYKSIRVVGRGTVRIDPEEVVKTDEWKRAKQQVSQIKNQHVEKYK